MRLSEHTNIYYRKLIKLVSYPQELLDLFSKIGKMKKEIEYTYFNPIPKNFFRNGCCKLIEKILFSNLDSQFLPNATYCRRMYTYHLFGKSARPLLLNSIYSTQKYSSITIRKSILDYLPAREKNAPTCLHIFPI